MSIESSIGEEVNRRTRPARMFENTALVGGVSVPVAAGLLLMAGLLTPVTAGIVAGVAVTVAGVVKFIARDYRKAYEAGSKSALGEWRGKQGDVSLKL